MRKRNLIHLKGCKIICTQAACYDMKRIVKKSIKKSFNLNFPKGCFTKNVVAYSSEGSSMEKWLELECVDLRGIPERERESFVEKVNK